MKHSESSSIEQVRLLIFRQRRGLRPITTHAIPHRQLDQLPPAPLFQALTGRCLKVAYVSVRESRMTSRDTMALWIPDEVAHGPADAFIDDHEFCHIHPLPEGSLHLTLPAGVREGAILHGWAEEHPLVPMGAVSPALVMVYAPRDEEELEVVYSLFLSSFHFAHDHL
jgi:phospholipase/carboxylesterase